MYVLGISQQFSRSSQLEKEGKSTKATEKLVVLSGKKLVNNCVQCTGVPSICLSQGFSKLGRH